MSTGAYDCAILQELRGIKEELSLINRQNEIVRCGECKHYKESVSYGANLDKVLIGCPYHPNDPDWFCADGERSET